ncbi:MAG: arsenic metallochaperone ArsD family protein, partial [Proteobacteria bacterium]|nr:arsenic metallochaperone ArsD family protein [Pseudomonadota bacterium]
MSKLSIFEPAMCCETGVCGVDADTILINFT